MLRKLRNYLGIYTKKDVQGMAKWLVTYDQLKAMHEQGYDVSWPSDQHQVQTQEIQNERR